MLIGRAAILWLGLLEICLCRSTFDNPLWAAGQPVLADEKAIHRLQFEKKYAHVDVSQKDSSTPPKQGPLEIFVMPHSHCDVGWHQTVFGYYNSSVANILTTVTNKLAADSKYRFVWSEVKWFEMWWPDQTPQTQAIFRTLVRTGQLEFVGAGWSQSDEVSPSYRDMVDNTLTGHEYLLRILGDDCPNRRCVRFGYQVLE
jgi:hypothetical protein